MLNRAPAIARAGYQIAISQAAGEHLAVSGGNFASFSPLSYLH